MGHPQPQRRHRVPIDPRRNPYFCDWGAVVGGRIRRLREARGTTLRELVEAPLIPGGGRHSIGYLSRLERGWASPPFYTYVAIVEALGEAPGRVFGPDVVEVDPTEAMLLKCLRRTGIDPAEALTRLLGAGSLHPDHQLAAVDHHGIAAVE